MISDGHQWVRFEATCSLTGSVLEQSKDHPLHMACGSGNQELVDWILDTPAGQNQRTKTAQRTDDFSWIRALNYDHLALALKLVKNDIRFIATNDMVFWHVFQVALESQSMELIDYLWPYAEKQEV